MSGRQMLGENSRMGGRLKASLAAGLARPRQAAKAVEKNRSWIKYCSKAPIIHNCRSYGYSSAVPCTTNYILEAAMLMKKT